MAASNHIESLNITGVLYKAAGALRGASAGSHELTGHCPHLVGLVCTADLVADDLYRLAEQIESAELAKQ